MSLETSNLLLQSLSSKCRNLLMSKATQVSLPLKMSLYEAEQAPPYAYFPTSGIASVVTSMANGSTAEVGLIGREGLIGGVHLLGSLPNATHCFVQLEGTALRIPMVELRKAFLSSNEIRSRILEFVQGQVLNVSQLAACQRLHEAEARLSRWLLMAQDLTQEDVLQFTQEFLAKMLGAQRTTVTEVARALQDSGLIEYRRGHVKIVDRKNLEKAACDCYQVTKRLYTKLYNGRLSL